jgi:hypothetical protein
MKIEKTKLNNAILKKEQALTEKKNKTIEEFYKVLSNYNGKYVKCHEGGFTYYMKIDNVKYDGECIKIEADIFKYSVSEDGSVKLVTGFINIISKNNVDNFIKMVSDITPINASEYISTIKEITAKWLSFWEYNVYNDMFTKE